MLRRRNAFTLTELIFAIFIISTSFLSMFGLLGVSILMRTERTLGSDDENFATAFFDRFDASPEMRIIFNREVPLMNNAAKLRLRDQCMAALDASGWMNDSYVSGVSSNEGVSRVNVDTATDWRNTIKDGLSIGDNGPIYEIEMLNRYVTIKFHIFNIQDIEDQVPISSRILRIDLEIKTNLPSETITHSYTRYAYIASYTNLEGHGPWAIYGHGSLSKEDVWTNQGYPGEM